MERILFISEEEIKSINISSKKSDYDSEISSISDSSEL